MAQDITRLARQIYHRDLRMVEQEAREQFVKGLPPKIQVAVAAANPKTLDDCIDSVTQLQTVLHDKTLEEIEASPCRVKLHVLIPRNLECGRTVRAKSAAESVKVQTVEKEGMT